MRIAALLIAAALGGSATTPALAQSEGMERVLVDEYDHTLNVARQIYDTGNWDRAFETLSRTARWGDKWSQFALGTLYLEGKGTDENVLLAYAWIRTAAESGVDEFVDAAERLRDAIPVEHHADMDGAANYLIERFGMEATGVRCDKRRQVGSNRKVFDCRRPHSLLDQWVEVPRYDGEA